MLPYIVYDDGKDFPWLLLYGEGELWAKFRTKRGAESAGRRLYLFLEAYGVLG